MSGSLQEEVLGEIKNLLVTEAADSVPAQYRERIGKGDLSRDEDPATHLCVYFAALDSRAREVFLGHHKKSGLWLFSGGHLDAGENLRQAAVREIGEEWGLDAAGLSIGEPELLTITPIENAAHPCRRHFDVWYFIDVAEENFRPDLAKLAAEAYGMCWFNLEEARQVVTDPNTRTALDFIEKKYFQS